MHQSKSISFGTNMKRRLEKCNRRKTNIETNSREVSVFSNTEFNSIKTYGKLFLAASEDRAALEVFW